MITIDVSRLSEEFLVQGRLYRDGPDLMKALELDDSSARLMSAAGHCLHDTELSSLLHDLRKAVRNQEHERFRGLFEEIERRLTPQG